MANEDAPNFDDDSDAFRQFKELIERMFGGQFDKFPFMNLFNDPDIIKKLQDDGHVNFGFSLSTDDNGHVNINSFNPDMVFPNQSDPQVKSANEPFFDVMEDGNLIIIVGDVPGYNKEELHIGSKGSTKLVIKGSNKTDSFTKEIDLPEFDIKSVKAKLRNGSLEISVQAVKDELDGYKINIE